MERRRPDPALTDAEEGYICLSTSLVILTKTTNMCYNYRMTSLRERTFSAAKTELSTVMDEVVHERQPQLIRRHGNKETMLLVRPEDARRWLGTFRLTLNVTLDEGEVAVSAAPVGTLGIGDSLDSALDDLVVELRSYAHRFFVERPHFYSETPAAQHAPWLLRFILTPPEEQRTLLDSDIEASVPVASAV